MESATTDVAVRVQGLSKCFKVYPNHKDIILEYFLRSKRHSEFWALRDINFEVKRGEAIGLIGKNGSGKSTLLKIITGVLDHTEGNLEINGKVSAILELGTGFHPEYTGRENIVRGGMVLGMSRKEIESKMESIIDFSGLAKFIDRPFKSFSSGMQARLTFATATAIQPDIFIVDEALATGDAFFVQKSLKRVRDICASGCTAILVSHNSGVLASICQRVIWLDKGRIRRIGNAVEVLREYDLSVHEDLSSGEGRIEHVELNAGQALEIVPLKDGGNDVETIQRDAKTCAIYRRGPIRIERVELLDDEERPTSVFGRSGSMIVRAHYTCDGPVPEETLGMAISVNRYPDLTCVNQFNTHCFTSNQDLATYSQAPYRRKAGGRGVFDAIISPLQLCDGDYILSIGLLPNLHDEWSFYEYHHHAYRFAVRETGWKSWGVFEPMLEWKHQPSASAHAEAA